MKLYGTIASERASKGQGGNDNLEVDIFVGSAKESIKILEGSIRKEKDGYAVYFTTIGQGAREQCIDTFIKEKGERQKGGTWCDNECAMETPTDEKGNCFVCGKAKGERQKGEKCLGGLHHKDCKERH